MIAHAPDVTDVAILTLATWMGAAVIAVTLWHLAVTACKRGRLAQTKHHYPKARYRRRR